MIACLLMGKIAFFSFLVIAALLGAYILFSVSSKSLVNPLTNSGNNTVTPTTVTTQNGKNEQLKNTITLSPQGFFPATLTVKTGTNVVWVNNSGQEASIESNPHPTHTSYPPLNLGSVSDGSTVELTFTKSGTYGYHNHLNPSQTGTVIVQ